MRRKGDGKFVIGSVPWNKGLKGYMSGRVVSEETREKLRISSTGRTHSEESKTKISNAHKLMVGERNPFYGKKHTDKAKKLNGLASKERWGDIEFRKKVAINRKGKQSGSKNPRWKGGITPLHQMVRDCERYLNWRTLVFSRDLFTCVQCGQVSGDIEAHHKVKFSSILSVFLLTYNQFSPIEDKETLVRLAEKFEPFWNIDNGETLCKKCHKLNKGVLSEA